MEARTEAMDERGGYIFGAGFALGDILYSGVPTMIPNGIGLAFIQKPILSHPVHQELDPFAQRGKPPPSHLLSSHRGNPPEESAGSSSFITHGIQHTSPKNPTSAAPLQ
ncbi:hypothetical protein BJX64DRAFT_207758 [Aspergillus heterothallicus]